MDTIPVLFVFIGAVIVYLWHQRSRENEVLPEYGTALLDLADRLERSEGSQARADHIREMAFAVSGVAGGLSGSISPDRARELRGLLAYASSPSLIEEAGLARGTPRHHHTYKGLFRRMGAVEKLAARAQG